MTGLPDNWRLARLQDVGQAYGGGTPSTDVSEYWNGGIPWLVPSEATKNNGLYIAATERTITEVGLKNCASRLFASGTVMMTSRATIGEVVINSVPMATNQGFINVACNPSVILNEYLAYWIIQNRPTFVERAHGVTFREITRSNFKTIPIPLPPLPEQRAIARVLRSVQAAREARQREVALERELKAALMEYLFTRGTRGEPTKLTPIGEMPESWEVVQLGEVSQVVSGGTPSRTEPLYWGGGIPWVKTGEVNYGIIQTTEETITEEGLANSSTRIVPAGTLLMAMYGQGITRGRVALLGIDAAINQACAAVFASTDRLLTGYALQILTYSYESIRNLGHGANQKNLNAMLVRSVPLALPPTVQEQGVIAGVLGACDAKIAALEREMALLDELFRALLEELMTGRLSVAGLALDAP